MVKSEKQKVIELLRKSEIESVLIDYAQACDQRAWASFDRIFAEDVCVDYGGEYQLSGREAVVSMIKSLLGGCGPTQHLLGNFRIAFSSDIKAKCHCYVRASHAGKGESNACFYEVWAEYQDELEYRNDQWLIARRTMSVIQEVGQRAILGPES